MPNRESLVKKVENFRKNLQNISNKAMFDYAMLTKNKKDILEALKPFEDFSELKEALASIEKDDRESIKTTLREVGDKNMLDKILQVETSIAIDEAMKIGSICGVMAALTVGVGCGVAGVGLSMLVIAGIAAGLAVGVVAGCITYAILKPSSELDEVNSKEATQPLMAP